MESAALKWVCMLLPAILSATNAGTTESVCPSERKSYPDDCYKFYRCLALPSAPRGYVWVPSKCSFGLVFQPDLSLCVVPGESTEYWDCNAQSQVDTPKAEFIIPVYDGSGDIEYSTGDAYDYDSTDESAPESTKSYDAIPYKNTPGLLTAVSVDIPESVPETSDHGESLASHMQHLTQLIASMQSQPSNKHGHIDEMTPARLNAILAQQNIVAQEASLMTNDLGKETMRPDGKLSPDRIKQIIAQQTKLSKIKSYLYPTGLTSFLASKPTMQHIESSSTQQKPSTSQKTTYQALQTPLEVYRPLIYPEPINELPLLPQDTWYTVLSLSREMIEPTEAYNQQTTNQNTHTLAAVDLSDSKNKILSLGSGNDVTYMTFEKYKNSILPLLKGSQVSVLPCSRGIREANKTDCTRYYICQKATAQVVSYSCPPFTAFSSDSRMCEASEYLHCVPNTTEEPENTMIGTHHCNQPGFVADHEDAQKYYACFQNRSGILIEHHLTCQSKLYFCETTHVCTLKERCPSLRIK